GARRLQAQACHVPEVRRAGHAFTDDIHLLLERLAAVGLSQVGVVDMQKPPFPVAVVRVVIPGLEGICTFPSYSPGPRAWALAANPSPSF
ncbi:MAG: YcaO-like family protein, partial [bacterium]